MRSIRLAPLAIATFALAACNPFHREPVTEVSRDLNANARWSAALVTPAALVGAVQINGTASMQPGGDTETTVFALRVDNATPGGQHPWQIHRGQCGADRGIFGPANAYGTVKIGDDGRGESRASIRERTPEVGDYFAIVYASAANPETVVACGNLAPPAR